LNDLPLHLILTASDAPLLQQVSTLLYRKRCGFSSCLVP